MEQTTETNTGGEQIVQVRADLLGDFQRLALLTAHHEQLLAILRRELADLLRVGHGINVNEPGWRIADIEQGIVAKVPLPKPTVVPAAAEQPE